MTAPGCGGPWHGRLNPRIIFAQMTVRELPVGDASVLNVSVCEPSEHHDTVS